MAISLAVAESQFQFEHRDLHWGNVLVAPTTETTMTFILNGKPIIVRTHGKLFPQFFTIHISISTLRIALNLISHKFDRCQGYDH